MEKPQPDNFLHKIERFRVLQPCVEFILVIEVNKEFSEFCIDSSFEVRHIASLAKRQQLKNLKSEHDFPFGIGAVKYNTIVSSSPSLKPDPDHCRCFCNCGRKGAEVKGLYGNTFRLALCKECEAGNHKTRKVR